MRMTIDSWKSRRVSAGVRIAVFLALMIATVFYAVPRGVQAVPNGQSSCTPQDLIANGGFETADSGWTLSNSAQYNTYEVRSGNQSMLLGIRPPTGDSYLFSSTWQQVTIPADAATATLSFWYKPYSESFPWTSRPQLTPEQLRRLVGQVKLAPEMPAGFDALAYLYDTQMMLVRDATNATTLATVMYQNQNTGVWTYKSYDMSAFIGQTVTLYFDVLNNGYYAYDGRSWMFLDDVSLTITCGETATPSATATDTVTPSVTPTPTNSATPTNTPTPSNTPVPSDTPTPTSTPSTCQEKVLNGEFETSGTGWTLTDNAQYNSDAAHGGSQSMLLGIRPPNADAYLYSSVWQQVTIPANATSATLRFWYKPYAESQTWASRPKLTPEQMRRVVGQSEPAPQMPPGFDAQAYLYDTQMMLVRNAANTVTLATVMYQNQNTGAWTSKSYDMSAFIGQTVTLYFDVLNNGYYVYDGRSWMYLDDVSLEVCSVATETPTATATSTATETPVPGTSPTATPTATATTLPTGTYLSVEPPTQTVLQSGGVFTVAVWIHNVTDLGGFQFDMVYSPTLVHVTGATLGGFLSSTGRTSSPLNPVIDNNAGRVTFGGFSFGTQPGPNGDGLLATLDLSPQSTGTSPLTLQNSLVTTSSGSTISHSTVNGEVSIVTAYTATPTATAIPTATETPTPAAYPPPGTIPAPTASPTPTYTPGPVYLPLILHQEGATPTPTPTNQPYPPP